MSMCGKLINRVGPCLLLIFLGLSACNPTPKVTDESVEVIDDVTLTEIQQSEPDLVIVDVRPVDRYRTGHLPGAINIQLPDLTPTDARFHKVKHIVVYADGPRNTLSHAAVKKLLAGGKAKVSDFRGGIEAWRKADRQLVTEP
jgi:rhodanese-related sulfurtransferase